MQKASLINRDSRTIAFCLRVIARIIFRPPLQGLQESPLNITGTRERYILDKSYWLVSSFNGNVVPLNGVHTELKRKGKNKGMKYKPDGGKETAIDR